MLTTAWAKPPGQCSLSLPPGLVFPFSELSQTVSIEKKLVAAAQVFVLATCAITFEIGRGGFFSWHPHY